MEKAIDCNRISNCDRERFMYYISVSFLLYLHKYILHYEHIIHKMPTNVGDRTKSLSFVVFYILS